MAGWRGTRGIDDDYFSKSVYNAVSDSIISQFYSLTDKVALHRIYLKKLSEENYRLLTKTIEGIDCRNFLVSQNSALVFVNSHENFVRTTQGKQVFSGNWHLLQEFDLETGESRIIYSEKNDINNHLTDRRIWIWDIQGYNAVTNELFVTVAIEKEISPHHIKVEYWLSKIDRETGKIDPISLFPNVFF
jgi:hypothetical protein